MTDQHAMIPPALAEEMRSNEQRQIIVLEATFTKANRTADRGVTTTCKSTRAVSTEEYMLMDRLLGNGAGCNGRFVFIPDSVSETEALEFQVPEENAKHERFAKTDSQRQYAIQFVYWKLLGEPDGDFQSWRHQQNEYIIGEYKGLISEIEERTK